MDGPPLHRCNKHHNHNRPSTPGAELYQEMNEESIPNQPDEPINLRPQTIREWLADIPDHFDADGNPIEEANRQCGDKNKVSLAHGRIWPMLKQHKQITILKRPKQARETPRCPLRCAKCHGDAGSFEDVKALDEHILTSANHFACCYCDHPVRDHRDFAQLQTHYTAHHGHVYCDFCNTHFANNREKRTHMEVEHRACDVCGTYFVSLPILRDHCRTAHVGLFKIP